MPAKASQSTKRESLNLRIRPAERGLIDRAAQLTGKTRTDFVLDAARRAAEEALLDRLIIRVDRKAYDEFLARLDAPPQPNERLKRMLRTPPVWR
jgi:uncharacterized protein (DUF1778 family)